MRRGHMLRAGLATAALALAGCVHAPPSPSTGLPTSGVYLVGKPYQVGGLWQYPAEDWSYDETGLAAWSSPGFRSTVTANGEINDGTDLTAAHRTLPLPSLVRVTNLENGRSIVVRVNDRGPASPGRVIDLSRRGAQLLGFEERGTASVRVQILAEESRAIGAVARRNTPAELLAGTEAPTPRAAPRAQVEIASASMRPPALPEAPRPLAAPATIPGAEVDGRFLPAPVVTNLPVRGDGRLYVQVGAFAAEGHAQALRTRLAPLGRAMVMPATVGRQRTYRVRLGPVADVPQADALLSRVLQSGLTDAKIVVD